MKIVKKVNGNLGELILSSKGFESSSGTKILSKALKRCQAIKKNNKIMLFSYPDYNTEKQYIDACLKIGFRKENIYVYEKRYKSKSYRRDGLYLYYSGEHI